MSNGTQSPFLFGNVVGRGFSTLFRNIIPFGTIAILLMIPYAGVNALQATGNLPRGTTFSWILEIIVGYILPQVLTAAIVHGTFQAMLGRRPSVGDAIACGFKVIVPVVGVGIVTGVLVVITALPAILVATIKLGGLQILLAFGLFAFPVFVLVVFFVAIPAYVVERKGVGSALGRSAQLTKGERWRVLAVLAIVWAVGLGALLVVGALAFAAMQTGSVLAPPLMLALAAAFYYALNAAMATVAYHDLRVAREGVSTEDIAAVFD